MLNIDENDSKFLDKFYKPSGPDGNGCGKWRKHNEEEMKIINLYQKI